MIKRGALSSISGHTSRVGAYASAVLDKKLRAEIDHFPGHRYLVYGRNLVVLHMSRQAYAFWSPWAPIIVGTAYADHLVGDARALYETRFLPMFDARQQGSPTAARFFTKSTNNIPGFPQVDYRDWYATCPHPLIWDVFSRSITREDYEAEKKKFIPIWE